MRNVFIILTLLVSLCSTVHAAQPNTATNSSSEQSTALNTQYENLLAYYFAAARTDESDVIEQFVHGGIPINSINIKGYTALMIATYHGNKNSVNTLLQLGANACLEDNRGNTALMAAIFRGEFSIAKTLVSQQCDTEHQNKAGQTAQQFAETFGQQKIIALLNQVKK
ncbi:ankyrin repeat domain-containing protein [Paraglaciecola aquimarina]|uniref:Ankyrin repeat domain-containing protein n=1 Tax=Paraglaciecola aquimarina TaxID=1235557 RepID=A0ABU3SR89_9ALTE|nr:ankyrin repeat domain-containing protein [Paraglaciecola aquimarina]MDU0352523.1 ankyrin repeat domain-containing protein [Paraglaciecola aquimarina]